jgi:hypothetical protein
MKYDVLILGKGWIQKEREAKIEAVTVPLPSLIKGSHFGTEQASTKTKGNRQGSGGLQVWPNTWILNKLLPTV